MRSIRRWVAPPTFAGDPQRTSQARPTHTIALATLATALLWVASFGLVGSDTRWRPACAVASLGLAVAAVTLNRRGRVRAAAWALVLGGFVLVTVASAVEGGVAETTFGWYLLVALGAALLLGRDEATLLGVLGVAASVALMRGAQTGLVPSPPEPSLAALVIAHAAVLIMMVSLLHVASRNIRDSRARAQRELAGRQLAGAALEETEKALRALLDATTETAFLLDTSGMLLAANETLARTAGRTARELVGRDAFAMLPPALAEARHRQVAEVIRTGRPHRFEDRGADGRWYDNNLFPIADDTGQVTRVAVFAQDVTDSREAEASLRRLAERLAGLHQIDGAILAAGSPEEIAAAALEGVSRLLPPVRAAVLEIDGERRRAHALVCRPVPAEPSPDLALAELGDLHELRQGRPRHLPDAEALPAADPYARRVLTAGARSALLCPLQARGRLMGVLEFLSPVPEAFEVSHLEVAGEVANHLAVALEQARLYQERQRHALEMEEAYARLARLDQAKADFIGVASHELRTPLTLILGYTDLLEQHPLLRDDPAAAALLGGVSQGAGRLKALLQDMLDVSLLDRGGLRVRRGEISLPVLVSGVLDEFASSLAERSLSLEVTGVEGLPPVAGDADALAKALRHLVMNAIKFTPNGRKVAVRARTTTGERGEPLVELAVEDTGIGIDPADQGMVFESFFRTGDLLYHSSGRTKFKGGGPGLGLALARKVAEAHGGRLWVESPGHDETACPGSRFVLELPVSAAEPVPAGRP